MFTNTTTINKKAFYLINKKTVSFILFCFACSLIALTCAIFLSCLHYKYVFLPYALSVILLALGAWITIKYKKFEKGAIGKTTVYTFNENTFTSNANNQQSELSYSVISEIKQADNYLLLLLNNSQSFVVYTAEMPSGFIQFITGKITNQTN